MRKLGCQYETSCTKDVMETLRFVCGKTKREQISFELYFHTAGIVISQSNGAPQGTSSEEASFQGENSPVPPGNHTAPLLKISRADLYPHWYALLTLHHIHQALDYLTAVVEMTDV
jgi:hypothetical protein